MELKYSLSLLPEESAVMFELNLYGIEMTLEFISQHKRQAFELNLYGIEIAPSPAP